MLSQLKVIQNNAGYTLCAQKAQRLFVSHERGIAPIMRQLARDPLYFQDCVIIDRVIGKAAAMLYHRSQAAYIHACLMSEGAEAYLRCHHIAFSYDELCPYIINRTHDGMCPMEACVMDVNDPAAAQRLLNAKVKSMKAEQHA